MSTTFTLPADPHASAGDDVIRNFAYGSNTALRYIREYCPSASLVMRASLPNYRIEFRRYSENLAGGISTIIANPGYLVHGVLYDISRKDIEALDELEDVPLGIYVRETMLVLGEDGGWHAADLYRVAKPDGPYTPSRQYVEYMLEGAREHEQPEAYVANIERILAAL